MQNTTSRMNHRGVGLHEQFRRFTYKDLWRGRSTGAAIAFRRLNIGDLIGEFAVHDVLGYAEMHNARPPDVALAKRASRQFGNAVEGFSGLAPLAHRPDHRSLIEILVGAAAIGIDDLRTTPARDEQYAVAFTALHRNACQRVRRAGPVARDTNSELAR